MVVQLAALHLSPCATAVGAHLLVYVWGVQISVAACGALLPQESRIRLLLTATSVPSLGPHGALKACHIRPTLRVLRHGAQHTPVDLPVELFGRRSRCSLLRSCASCAYFACRRQSWRSPHNQPKRLCRDRRHWPPQQNRHHRRCGSCTMIPRAGLRPRVSLRHQKRHLSSR